MAGPVPTYGTHCLALALSSSLVHHCQRVVLPHPLLPSYPSRPHRLPHPIPKHPPPQRPLRGLSSTSHRVRKAGPHHDCIPETAASAFLNCMGGTSGRLYFVAPCRRSANGHPRAPEVKGNSCCPTRSDFLGTCVSSFKR